VRRHALSIAVALSGCGFDSTGTGDGGGTGDASSDVPETTLGGETSSGGATVTTSPGSSETTAATITTSVGSTLDTGSSGSVEDAGDSSGGSSSSSGSESSTGDSLECPELLWVCGSGASAGTDVPLVERIAAAGFTITFAIDSDVQAADAVGYCAVLISGTADGADVGAKLREIAEPTVVWEWAIYDDMGFAASGEFGVAEGLNAIDIVAPEHPLAAGLDGEVEIYSGTGRIGWSLGVGADVVAERADLIGAATLFEYPAGALLVDGVPAAGLRIALPIMDAPDGIPQPAALDIFENAVRRATGG
jgi:hypothetical protein